MICHRLRRSAPQAAGASSRRTERARSRCFGEGPAEAGGGAAIADAADVGIRTVTGHFPTKEDLLFANEPFTAASVAERLTARKDGEPALDAFRDWMATTMAALTAERTREFWRQRWLRSRLILQNPDLRGRSRGDYYEHESVLAAAIAADRGELADALAPRLVASGLGYTLLRNNAYMQNLLMSAASIAMTSSFGSAARDGRVGMIDTRDVAAVAAEIAASPSPHAGRTYWPTGPKALTFSDAAGVLSKVLGRPITFNPLTFDEQKQAMIDLGLPEGLAAMNAQAVDLFAEGDSDYVTDDVASILGYRDPIHQSDRTPARPHEAGRPRVQLPRFRCDGRGPPPGHDRAHHRQR